MKRVKIFYLPLLLVFVSLTSCQTISNIFTAGFKTGIWLAIIAIILVVFFVIKIGSKNK